MITRWSGFRRSNRISVLSATLALLCLNTPILNAQNNPLPFVNAPLVPDALTPGSAAFTLTVNGTDFAAGATVYWNGSARPTTFISQGQLTAAITAGDVATAGTAYVTVSNPAPRGGQSSAVPFVIDVATPSVFFLQSVITPNLGSESAVAADFNGDGKLDLAVADEFSSDVWVLLGNGDGTFQAPKTYGAESYPFSIVAGDFNGDGNLDLAVSNYSSNSVSVLLGNGDGTFQASVSYGVGDGPAWLLVGDIEGNGRLDLLVANALDGTSSLLLGDGDGTFQLEQAEVVYSTGPLGDFNGDGKLDVLTQGDNQVCVALGNGNGTFQPEVCYGIGGYYNYAATADFNGDGNLDLAVAAGVNAESGVVSVLLGNGDGTFQPAANFAVGSDPYFTTVADFNGDGKLDIAVSNIESNSNSVLLGNGDGTFQPQITQQVGSGGVGALTAGDFNNDGRVDLVVDEGYSPSPLTLLLQTTADVSPLSLQFPLELVGATSPLQQVSLTNSATQPLDISSITLGGADSKDFLERSTCPQSLPPQATCTVTIEFRPLARGPRTASLSFTDAAAGSPQTVALSGTATVVGLVPGSLNFGTITIGQSSAPQSVTLTNTGKIALAISKIQVGNGDFHDYEQTNTCGASLPAGGSCTISVTFSPSGGGTRSASLEVFDGGGASPQTVSLSGIGVRGTE
jgi:FG-GAP-like repeat